ncbi:MAG: hypothetical protein IKN81_07660 [Oscillospiraceae bacterium]|nr:hypothetical protein [Oscillospiraceae bacterium]
MVTQHRLPSPQLGREVTVRVYRPERAEGRALPVLYFYDGDVLFRHGAAGFDLPGYDAAHPGALPLFLAVGIVPPGDRWQRTAELAPFTKAFDTRGADFEPVVHGRGEALLSWVLDDLKPWVDAQECTVAEDTALGGMSSGALNAMYGAMRHGDVFRRLLLHGPAFNLWLSELLATEGSFEQLRYCYMDIGTEDATRMSAKEDTMRSALRMRDELLARGMDAAKLNFHVIPGGTHSPATWRATFPDALRWIFQDRL